MSPEEKSKMYKRLESFRRLDEGWMVQADRRGNPVAEGGPISDTAYAVAIEFIQGFPEIKERLHVFPSIEHGVMFEIGEARGYQTVVEIERTGNIVSVLYDADLPSGDPESDIFSADHADFRETLEIIEKTYQRNSQRLPREEEKQN